jgi:hypothetical protein
MQEKSLGVFCLGYQFLVQDVDLCKAEQNKEISKMSEMDIIMRIADYIQKDIGKQIKGGLRTGEPYIKLDQIAATLDISLDEVNQHLAAALEQLNFEIAERASATVRLRGKSGVSQRWTPPDA